MEKDIRYTKHGWIDLSNLTKTKDGRIDWKKSIGKIIQFQYYDINNKIIIKEKQEKHVVIDIPNYVTNYIIPSCDLTHLQLQKCLNIVSSNFKYDIGDIVNGCKILNRFKKDRTTTKEKYYHCKCMKDGYERNVSEYSLNSGKGCPVCSNNVILKGVNDVSTTRPDVAKLLYNKEDAFKYGAYSKVKVDFLCPRCNNISTKSLDNISYFGFSCPFCSDNISYPEKFTSCFLSQVIQNKAVKREKKFDWSKNVSTSFKPEGKDMKYDFYLKDFNCIIETHGEQHYNERGYNGNGTYNEIYENDLIKEKIAIQNGINHYIVLDCRKSNLNFIKNSIMNSDLPAILGFDEESIDWEMCDRYATTSLVFEAAKLWDNGDYSPTSIGKVLDLNRNTIRNYLRKAQSLNLLTTPYPLPKSSTPKQSKSSLSAS